MSYYYNLLYLVLLMPLHLLLMLHLYLLVYSWYILHDLQIHFHTVVVLFIAEQDMAAMRADAFGIVNLIQTFRAASHRHSVIPPFFPAQSLETLYPRT